MNDEDSIPWSREVDVIVIGGGGGGMAAAISAAENAPEADVLLLQKIGSLGGSTTMAVGSFAAAGTALQEENGVHDWPDAHFEDLDKYVAEYSKGAGRSFYFEYQGVLRDKDDLELRRLLVEEAAATLDWLSGLGCEFSGPHPDPPHRVPRVHAITPDTDAYPRVLGEVMEETGVEMQFRTEAYELIVEDGRVQGVMAKESKRRNPSLIKANSGVILATGDFINNQELREKFTTNAETPPVNEHNTGDGFIMAKDVGAEWVNMDIQRLTLRFGDPLWLTPRITELVDNGAILLNKEGRRFVNEIVDYDQLLSSVMHQPDHQLYILFGESVADRFTNWPHRISTWPGKAWGYIDDYRDTDFCYVGEKLSTFAQFETEVVVETVDQFNAAARGERVDRFGRTGFDEQIRSSFYLLGPIQPYSTITEGGVKVDENMRILGENGRPIDGLYAAGSIAGGLHLVGHGHHHSWIFTSGRIAGEHVGTEAHGAQPTS